MALHKGTAALCVGVGLCAGVGVYAAAVQLVEPWRQHALLESCVRAGEYDRQIDCVFEGITDEMKRGGVSAGMELFSRAYARFPTMAVAGCHAYSHRTGDVAYYELYRTLQNLDSMDFPQSTTACGYGFYHGFLEHIIQDNPTEAFVTDTCEYFKQRLGGEMRDIGPICYHGAGHGLMLAQVEQVDRNAWGDLRAFAEQPAELCNKLPSATEREKEQCKDGLFTMLVQWMQEGNYGFAMRWDNPLSVCTGLPPELLRPCYAETAQKLAQATKDDPAAMARLAETIPEPYRVSAFTTGVAGMVQVHLNTGKGYEGPLELCLALPSRYIAPCVSSIVGGLFEHGAPQQEYIKALALCSDALVLGEVKHACFGAVQDKLSRFYRPERRVQICREFPESWQMGCLRTVGSQEE